MPTINNEFMTMRKLFILLLVLSMGQQVFSIPADPQLKKVRQADGRWLTLRVLGDEHGSSLTTEDGLPVAFNRSSNCFEYLHLDDAGLLVPSGRKALDISERSDDDRQWLRTLSSKGIQQEQGQRNASQQMAPQRRGMLVNDYPTTGSPRSLVLLIEFSDESFSSVDDPHSFYDRMLNEEGFSHESGANGSVLDYFRDCSNGLFTPQFVVVGPIKLSKEVSYYGGDEGSVIDANIRETLREACELIDDEVDFSEFDLNNDGYVDNIFFFYAGWGQNDNPYAKNRIWPQSSNLAALGVKQKFDGKLIGSFACSNELRYLGDLNIKEPTGIGTFVHEFGHVLGLADHYDTEGGTAFDPGPWDVMSTGSYNNNMHTPAAYSAFERNELDWMELIELKAGTDSVSCLTELSTTGTAYRVSCKDSDLEYFALEHRQQRGWDTYLPHHGMLLWHIEKDEKIWADNKVNTTVGHQRVDIVEADKILTSQTRSGDSFPGSSNKTDTTLISWDGVPLLSLDAIVERCDTILLVERNSSFVMPRPAFFRATAVADSSLTIVWAGVREAARYQLTMREQTAEGQPGAIVGDYDNKVFDAAQELTIAKLHPLTTYLLSLTAEIGSYRSEPLTLTLTTTDVPFEKRQSIIEEVSNMSEQGFTAHWSTVREAEAYELTLCRHTYDGDIVTTSYGFTDRNDGMPSGWTTSNTSYYSVSGCYGEAAPSLRMAGDGSGLEIAPEEYLLTGLSFWYRGVNATGSLLVLGQKGEQIDTIATLIPVAEGTIVDYPLDNYEKVKMFFNRNSGSVMIDDVSVTYLPLQRRVVEGYDRLNVGQTLQQPFSHLLPGGTYGLTVTGLLGEHRSLPSAEYILTLPGTPDAIHAPGVETKKYEGAPYRLSGQRATDSNRLHIMRGKKVIVR